MTRHQSLNMEDALVLAIWFYRTYGIHCMVRVADHVWSVEHY